MNESALAAVMNEWQRRYIEEPERFEAEWRVIQRTLVERAEGKEPSYGANCAAYMGSLAADLGLVA